MQFAQPKQVRIDKRECLVLPYSGPRNELFKNLRPFYAWVYKHHRWRMSDITIVYAQRESQGLVVSQAHPIKAEYRFDLDRYLETDIELPKGAEVRKLPPETLIVQRFRGAVEQVMTQEVQWIDQMARSNNVAPGYRERLVKVGDKDSPEWEIEVQLLLA
ncbi:MAG: hypothetical protein JW797_12600 [Bradymonadales bacterium]|nr:hypothetical protein [Bradymonadales bacterium]